MPTTAETLDMIDAHWQDSGISLLDVLDRLGQQSHGLPPFPRELVDTAPLQAGDPATAGETAAGDHRGIYREDEREERERDRREHERREREERERREEQDRRGGPL